MTLKQLWQKQQELNEHKNNQQALTEANFNKRFVAFEEIEADDFKKEQLIKSLENLDKVVKESGFYKFSKVAETAWNEIIAESIKTSDKQDALVLKEKLMNGIGIYSMLVRQARKVVNRDVFFVKENKSKQENSFLFEIVEPLIWNAELQEEVEKLMTSEVAAKVFLLGKNVKHPVSLSESYKFLNELKVDANTLREIQAAIEKLQGVANKYKNLGTLSQAIKELRANLTNVVSNKGILSGGNMEAQKTITRANVLYDAMFEFFVQDLPVIMDMAELERAKQRPDQPINAVLGNVDSIKVEKLFAARLQPTHWSNIMRYLTGGTKPNISSIINIDSFARDLATFTFQQLEALSKEGAGLPPPTQVEKQSVEALKDNGLLGNSENGQPAGTTPGATQKQVAELKAKYPDNPLMAASEIKLPDGTTIPDELLGKFVRMFGKGGDVWSVLQKWAEKIDGSSTVPVENQTTTPAAATETPASAPQPTAEKPVAAETQPAPVSKKRGRPAKAQVAGEPATGTPAVSAPVETQPSATASTPENPQELSAEEAFRQLMGSHG